MSTNVNIQKIVHDKYSDIARSASESTTTTAAGQNSRAATVFGYSREELQSIPQNANLGLSCGNPLAMASLKPGETVVDLGSGAGFDVFLASNAVGPEGKAIGVDMSEDMISLASKNAANHPIKNTTFVQSTLPNLSLDSDSADCIISNCVLNLLPTESKPKMFQEIFRVLKPGGRVSVSDILAKRPFDENIKNDIALYVGCIAGASLPAQYEEWMREAGFEDIVLVEEKYDLNIFKESQCDGNGCCGSKAETNGKCCDKCDGNGCCGSKGETNGKCCDKCGSACCADTAPKKLGDSCCGGCCEVGGQSDGKCCDRDPSSSCCADTAPKKSGNSCCGGCCEVGGQSDGKCCDRDPSSSCCADDEGCSTSEDVNFNDWAASYKVYSVKPL